MAIAAPLPRFTVSDLTILGATLAMAISLTGALMISTPVPVAPSTDIVGRTVVKAMEEVGASIEEIGINTGIYLTADELAAVIRQIPGDTGAIHVSTPR